MSIRTRFNPLGTIGRKALLPAGYIELEYLESTGTQYIDTGIYGTEHHGVEIKYQFYKLDDSSARLFGGRTGAGGTDAYAYIGSYAETASAGTNFYVSCNQGAWDHTLPLIDSNYHVVIWNKSGNSLSLLFDNVNFATDVGALSGKQFTHTFTTNIFRAYNQTAYAVPATCRVYYCKMYDAGKLVRNFIPALSPTGRPCMFDTVAQQPFYNEGTGEFKWKAKLPAGYIELEYLESTGTQWIDTGYAFLDDFSWEVDYDTILDNTTVFGGRLSNVRTAILFYSIGVVEAVSPIAQMNGSQTPFKLGAVNTGRHKVKMSVAANKGDVWIDGTLVYNKTPFTGTYISGTTQAIFADNFGSGNIQEFASSKVYHVKMWQNGKLVRNFIPALDPTGRPCMYDLVKRKTYYNAGTGEFLYG